MRSVPSASASRSSARPAPAVAGSGPLQRREGRGALESGRDAATAEGSTPLQWLSSLSELLVRSSCRRRGEPVGLDEGLDALARLWAPLSGPRDPARSVHWIGNGGSAAVASHMSQDLMNACGVRSHTLNDASLITCVSNDHGFERVFGRPLAVTGRAGDVLMAISSSGMSKNVVAAAQVGMEMGMSLVTFSAFSPANHLNGLRAELSFHTPTRVYGHAELAHEAMLHAVIDMLSQPGA